MRYFNFVFQMSNGWNTYIISNYMWMFVHTQYKKVWVLRYNMLLMRLIRIEYVCASVWCYGAIILNCCVTLFDFENYYFWYVYMIRILCPDYSFILCFYSLRLYFFVVSLFVFMYVFFVSLFTRNSLECIFFWLRIRRVFDRDGNGFITRDELQIAMEMMQENVTETQVNEMLQLADLDKDGKINYEGKWSTRNNKYWHL